MSEGSGSPIYYYYPNKGAPVFFAVAFTASGIFHLWQCIHYKQPKVMAVHPVACLLFAVGFMLREFEAYNFGYLNSFLGTFVATTTLIYAAAPILELANYIVLGRILAYIPYCSPLPPNRVYPIFGTLTFLVEVLTIVSIPWVTDWRESSRLQDFGTLMLKISLVLQIPVVLASLALAIIFQRRCRKQDSPEHAARVKGPLLTLYMSTALILGRCVFRTVEYFAISQSSWWNTLAIEQVEAFFYVFEATPMLLNELLWNVTFPMRNFPTSKNMYLARDGLTEAGAGGVPKDVRSSSATVMDRLNVVPEPRLAV